MPLCLTLCKPWNRPGISLSFVIKESWPNFPLLWETFLDRVMGFSGGGFFFSFLFFFLVFQGNGMQMTIYFIIGTFKTIFQVESTLVQISSVVCFI